MSLFLLLLAPLAQASETFEGYTFYGGDPHMHSGVSGDGHSSDVGSRASAEYNALTDLDALCAEAGLDWVAVTDHANDVFAASASDWAYGWSFVLEHDDDATGIVLIPAAELAFTAGSSPLGHKNFYFFGDEADLADLVVSDLQFGDPTDRDIGDCATLEAWLPLVGSAWGDMLVIPHHPMPMGPAPTSWDCYQEAWTPAVEVYSSWGNSLDPEADYDPTVRGVYSAGSVYTALEDYGYHLGFWAGTDNHFTSPGGLDHLAPDQHASSGGITIAMLDASEAWTRANLHAAFLDRRTLASSGPVLPLVVEYSSSGYLLATLGQDFEFPDDEGLTLTVRFPEAYDEAVTGVSVTGPDGDVSLTRVVAGTWEHAWEVWEVPEWSYAWASVDGPTFFGSAYVDDSNDTDEERVWASPSWATPVPADADTDGYESDTWGGGDCDDHDAGIHPGAADTWYDGVDSDCDGASDFDRDADGYTSDAWGGEDCDDGDSGVNPGAVETWYDGVDSDCDGWSDYDADQDGFRSFWFWGWDCNDRDASVHPWATETWYDGVDQDCDGRSDYDADMDRHDARAWGGDDCDDDDGAIHPGAREIWYDGVDRDCDGRSDYDADLDGFDCDAWGGDDCNDHHACAHPGAVETWYDGVDGDCLGGSDYDADLDGHDGGVWGGDDCDDGDTSIHPDATETWYDGVDQNCDGWSDHDADQDGHDAVVSGGRDCDDTDVGVHPDATEIWYDGVDQDCDGNDDDQDGDGWPRKRDCDDTDPEAWPGAAGWTLDCRRIPPFTRPFRLAEASWATRVLAAAGCATVPRRPWSAVLLLLTTLAVLARRRA
ncbi:MAG: hypothetical protein JXB39_01960 [Deltaproteobacteria bacterium]|nr:hypothetical protein [Deltaproteobacteria bacterium]